jgi:hypothetical protein
MFGYKNKIAKLELQVFGLNQAVKRLQDKADIQQWEINNPPLVIKDQVITLGKVVDFKTNVKRGDYFIPDIYTREYLFDNNGGSFTINENELKHILNPPAK